MKVKKSRKHNKNEVAAVSATLLKGVLLLRMPLLHDPKVSSTGKSIIVATTHGFRRVGVQLFGGREVYVNANACLYPDPTEHDEEDDEDDEDDWEKTD